MKAIKGFCSVCRSVVDMNDKRHKAICDVKIEKDLPISEEIQKAILELSQEDAAFFAMGILAGISAKDKENRNPSLNDIRFEINMIENKMKELFRKEKILVGIKAL